MARAIMADGRAREGARQEGGREVCAPLPGTRVASPTVRTALSSCSVRLPLGSALSAALGEGGGRWTRSCSSAPSRRVASRAGDAAGWNGSGMLMV